MSSRPATANALPNSPLPRQPVTVTRNADDDDDHEFSAPYDEEMNTEEERVAIVKESLLPITVAGIETHCSIDTFPVHCSTEPYDGYYKAKIFKMLLVSSHSGHILFLHPVPMRGYDGTILREVFPEGFPTSSFGHCLGDGHFRGNRGIITPPNLTDLKKKDVLRSGPAIVRMLGEIEEIGIIRARVEHRFSLTDLGRFGALKLPANIPCPGSVRLANWIYLAAAMCEFRKRFYNGTGNQYHEIVPEYFTLMTRLAFTASNRYGDAIIENAEKDRRAEATKAERKRRTEAAKRQRQEAERDQQQEDDDDAPQPKQARRKPGRPRKDRR